MVKPHAYGHAQSRPSPVTAPLKEKGARDISEVTWVTAAVAS